MDETTPETSEGAEAAPEEEQSRYQSVQSSVDRYLRFVDISAAILLAVATVATAWCAYQSARWSGVQATAFAQASSQRLAASNTFNLALAQINFDTETFIEWIKARESGDEEFFEFVNEHLISDSLRPFLDEWDAATGNEDQLQTPLDSEDYIGELLAPTIENTTEAELKFAEATDANQTSDDYVLATVLFASVLFFAGISNKFERLRIQGALVLMGFLMFLAGIYQIAGLPIH